MARLRTAAALAALLLLTPCLVVPAAADDTTPISAAPLATPAPSPAAPTALIQTPPPVSSGPAPVAAPTPAPAPVGAPVSLLPAGISATDAAAGTGTAAPAPADPDATGATVAADRPLPADIWHGTPRATVDLLLPQIQPTASPALQDLAFRLLASPAAVPDTSMPGSGAAPPPGALLAARVAQLSDLGRTDTAYALLRAQPPGQLPPDAGEALVELAFLNGDSKAGCGIVTGRTAAWQGRFWDEAQATCHILAGQTVAAQTSLDVLTDATMDDGDKDFIALLNRASGLDTPLPESLPAPQPLSLALLAKMGNAMPWRGLDQASLSVLRAIAVSPGLLTDARLIAAEKAAAFGALSPNDLARAYLAYPLSQTEKDQPFQQATQRANDAHARAILFNAAQTATDPAAQANFLVSLFDLASKAQLYPAVIRAAQPLLQALKPVPALQSEAGDIAHALYALDQPDAARSWYDIATPDQQKSLLLIAHIAGGGAVPDWSAGGLLPPQGAANTTLAGQVTLGTTLLSALGTPAPDNVLMPMLADSTISGTSWQVPAGGPPLILELAAADKRVGGTVLAVLATLGASGPTAPPPLLATAIQSLNEVGLSDEARHLALDAAIAGGL